MTHRRGTGRRNHGVPPQSAQSRPDAAPGSAALAYTLRAAARSGQVLTEKAIAPVAGIDPTSEHLESELGPVLTAINRTEDAAGRPLLTAVVVGSMGLPSAAFFAVARELGLQEGDDERGLWMRELRRVQEYWSRH